MDASRGAYARAPLCRRLHGWLQLYTGPKCLLYAPTHFERATYPEVARLRPKSRECLQISILSRMVCCCRICLHTERSDQSLCRIAVSMTVGSDGEKDGPADFLRQMKLYYGHFFPHDLIYRWLSYGNGKKGVAGDPTFFKRRELCFTLDGDIFVRYRSFQNGTELQQALKSKTPTKIDIGPVYTQDPEKRTAYKGDVAGAFKPVERELVFDIDLTDYDDVRNSSSGTAMSRQCWSLMNAAIQVMDCSLRQDFGFKHILWVYSGRRGVHCWVCDESARKMSDEQRAAVASYFAVYKGQEKGVPKVGLSAKMLNHPFVENAYDMLLHHWEQILEDQELLTTQRTRKLMLKIIVEGFLNEHESAEAWEKKLTTAMEDHKQGTQVNSFLWGILVAQAGSKAKHSFKWKRALQHVVFAFSYPRLDIEVSKKTNHLLKAPFCIHPKTGKVCIPISVKTAHEFNPDDVPTLSELIMALNECSSKGSMPQSRLQPILEKFEKCFLVPLERDSMHSLVESVREQNQHSLHW
eukprot:jgi/Ulvmu1/10608/UM065_0064.1